MNDKQTIQEYLLGTKATHRVLEAMRNMDSYVQRLEAENEHLRIGINNVIYLSKRPLPSERNRVTFWQNMAKDMRDAALRALDSESETS